MNVSRFSGKAVGIGGFVNVSNGTKAVVYCGSFTAGGLKVATGDGELHVVQEGTSRKFLEHVEEISFSAPTRLARGSACSMSPSAPCSRSATGT